MEVNVTRRQQAFYRHVCEECDNIASRKSLSDQIDAEQYILRRIAETLNESQLKELSRDLFGQSQKSTRNH